MVINGLRGLDIEVNLIGMPTNGKNVGMEGVVRSFHNYDFLLFPVSFYIEMPRASGITRMASHPMSKSMIRRFIRVNSVR